MASDDLGEDPFRLAGASPQTSTEEAPASSDVPEDTAEAAMIDTQAQTQPSLDAEAEAPAGWPDVDRRTSSAHGGDEPAITRPPIHATMDSRPARRDNPLVAGLVRAMREAAVSSRDETLSRLHVDAEARVEGIRSRATTEAAELRKRADADIADIREWSKAEMARIRQETEARIDNRKSELTLETQRHAESVERLVAEVQSVVETFRSDMDSFFERLLAEDDPARLAALAEQAPDAPDLSGEAPAALDMLEPADRAAAPSLLPIEAPATGAAASEAVGAEAEAPTDDHATAALEADAAAAAEVAAGEGLDLGDADAWPAAALAAGRREDFEPITAPDGTGEGTRLLVTGLSSVAGISAFKGALGQVPGVHSVSVSSGSSGEIVFALKHEAGIDLATAVEELEGFAARITDATTDGIAVVAHEPAA